jgi:hypothetical protein
MQLERVCALAPTARAGNGHAAGRTRLKAPGRGGPEVRGTILVMEGRA